MPTPDPPDLPARLRARAASLAAALPDPRAGADDDLTTLPILPPAWCRLCRAELIEAAGAVEAMREALRGLRGTLESFISYYEISRNHPDAELIRAECRRASAVLANSTEG